MHKVIITSIFVIIATLSAWGQSDRYFDISETPGQIIQMYNMDELFNQHKAFVYIKNETGKLIKVKDPQYYTELHSKQLKVLRIENIKKNTYWVLKNHGKELYLLMGKIDYCKSILSVSYWQQEYAKIFNSYSHYISQGASPDKLNSYKPITWMGFHMPQTMNSAPTMGYKIEDATAALITPSEITSENGFRTNDEYMQIKKDIEERIRLEKLEQERKDSIADIEHIIQVKIAAGSFAYNVFKDNRVFENAPRFNHISYFAESLLSKYTKFCMEKEWDYYLTIYKYNILETTFVGYCKGVELTFSKDALIDLELDDIKFLIRRASANKGEDIRKLKAKEYDRIFYSSDGHLNLISKFAPKDGGYSNDKRIGNKYVFESKSKRDDFLWKLGTGESVNNKHAGHVFTFVDILDDKSIGKYPHKDIILYSSELGYCYTLDYLFDQNFIDTDMAIKNKQKRDEWLDNKKEWEKRIIDKYGETNGKIIIQGKVRIGFTKEMCQEAWGTPYDINRTTTAYGIHEQWVYGHGNYLYFEDGILTTIQN